MSSVLRWAIYLSMKTFVIGIAGGSGSGKTTFAKRVLEKLPTGSDKDIQILSQDNYYRDQSDKFDHDGGAVNFDHPDALELDLLGEQIAKLKIDQQINVPVYDFATHKRLTETLDLAPSKILLIDGTLIYCNQKIKDALDLMIFIDVDESIRFERRLKRDTIERGRTPAGVKDQFFRQVKPMHDEFVEPTKTKAQIVVNDENFDEMVDQVAKECQKHL